MMDVSENLESLRCHIRDICVHDQERWASTWKAVLENPETTRHGLVLPDIFVQTLEENSVFLPKKTLRSLVTHFQAPNGGLQVAKFLKWVELSPPADHVDPELVFAHLPQPYRRIVKILERDILDVSWELIKQQSARFKAEAAAALAATARSTRSGVLNDQAAADPDDFEAAKKRCCKSFERHELGDSSSVSCISQHPSLPLTLTVFGDRSEVVSELPSSKIVLRLFNSSSHEVISEFTLPLPSQTDDPPPSSEDEPAAPQTMYQVTRLTPIWVRSVAQDGSTPAYAFGLQLTETTTRPAIGDQSESTSCVTSVWIYQLGGNSAADEQPLSFQLVAAGKFESLEWMELAPDGQHVALSTAVGSISIFKIPIDDDAADLVTTGESPTVLDLTSAPALMKIDNTVTLSESKCSPQVHFLVKPSSVQPSSAVSQAQALEVYAIVVCHETKVLKYTLRTSGANPATPRVSWTHLAPVTSSGVDSTTQFLVVGLADGSVAVWNTLDEIDHVFLSSFGTTNNVQPGSSQSDPRIDVVTMYRDEYVVAFSATSQQICIFDIRNPTAPQLLRVVTAPAPSPPQKDGIKIVALVETTSFLDLPIAVVVYSNGFLLVYDMRNAEAIGSLRYRSSTLSESNRLSSVLASQHGVSVAQTSSLDFYDWHQLLLASFPSSDHLLQQRSLAQVRPA
ncbi:hypothetical protein Gpo141_00011257 [Globisporangium polare]